MEKNKKVLIIVGLILLFTYLLFNEKSYKNYMKLFSDSDNYFRILSSYENQSVQSEITEYAKSLNKKIKMTYKGDLDIVDELNNNLKNYDAVWISNSMWLYMLNNPYLISNSKSLSISPVVFGIKKSKATELGLVNNSVSNTDILNLIREKKIKYVMPSVTQTNTGATAYLGFLSSLAGNPEVLTEEILQDEVLIKNLVDVFSGVDRVSGDESYLEEMVLNDSDTEAVIASEASLININENLKNNKKEQFYLIYPSDGVAINDSAFAFINNDVKKEDTFLKIQDYLIGNDGQKILEQKGLRTWYGGVNKNSDKNVFNKDWGIDTSKYLNVTKFPSKSVITSAINLYIESLRKPTHVVFCLDYSGSMDGDGNKQLVEAMDYILDYSKASKDKLQFSKGDKITVITFSSKINNVYTAIGHETSELINNIQKEYVDGSTALYDAVIKGIEILTSEGDDYTKTIIAMTDGAVNVGNFSTLNRVYKDNESKIPIYSITFGDAVESQLSRIADLSNARVFDGKTDLLSAFKEVRGYN